MGTDSHGIRSAKIEYDRGSHRNPPATVARSRRKLESITDVAISHGDNWWGSTVVVAVIVVLLHPYSSAFTIFSTRIVWLLCDSVVEATREGHGVWCVFIFSVIRGFNPKKQKGQRTDDQYLFRVEICVCRLSTMNTRST
jgi:hypothetical protein